MTNLPQVERSEPERTVSGRFCGICDAELGCRGDGTVELVYKANHPFGSDNSHGC